MSAVAPDARLCLFGDSFAFGTNDVDEGSGCRRVTAHRTLELLGQMLVDVRSAGWAALVIGPPPVADCAAAQRARQLSSGMSRVCCARRVPFVDVGAALATDPVWIGEVTTGDASHPSTNGYQRFARCVATPLLQWLDDVTDVGARE